MWGRRDLSGSLKAVDVLEGKMFCPCSVRVHSVCSRKDEMMELWLKMKLLWTFFPYFLIQIVSCVLPVQGILTFLHTLLEQLRTVNSACDKAILLWFEMAVKERRPDLKDKVKPKSEETRPRATNLDLVQMQYSPVWLIGRGAESCNSTTVTGYPFLDQMMADNNWLARKFLLLPCCRFLTADKNNNILISFKF